MMTHALPESVQDCGGQRTARPTFLPRTVGRVTPWRAEQQLILPHKCNANCFADSPGDSYV